MSFPPSHWHLYRRDADDTYGPASMDDLREWAASALIAPDDLLSADGETWAAAETVAELEMHYLIELAPGILYGPVTAGAIGSHLDAGDASGSDRVTDRRDGKTITAAAFVALAKAERSLPRAEFAVVRAANPRDRFARLARPSFRAAAAVFVCAILAFAFLFYKARVAPRSAQAPESSGALDKKRVSPTPASPRALAVAPIIDSPPPAQPMDPGAAEMPPQAIVPVETRFASQFAAAIEAGAVAFPGETAAQIIQRGLNDLRRSHGDQMSIDGCAIVLTRTASSLGGFQTWSELLFLQREHMEANAFRNECLSEAATVIAAMPANFDAAYWSGWVCLTGGDPATARNCWLHAEDLRTEASATLPLDVAMEVAYWNLGERSEATAREARRLELDAGRRGPSAEHPFCFTQSADVQRTAGLIHAATLREFPGLAGDQSYQYARAALGRGDIDLALSLLDVCAKLTLPDGELAAVLQDRATALLEKQRAEEAVAEFSESLRLASENADAYVGRARGYKMLRLWDLAIADLRSALTIAPNSTRALNSLAWLLATCPDPSHRNGSEALAAARKACDLSHWKKWVYVDTLAVAYAETGDLHNAASYQEEAIRIASGGPAEQSAMQARLVLYAKGQAYHE